VATGEDQARRLEALDPRGVDLVAVAEALADGRGVAVEEAREVPGVMSTSCAPRRMVPPRPSIFFCSGSSEMTAAAPIGSNSVLAGVGDAQDVSRELDDGDLEARGRCRGRAAPVSRQRLTTAILPSTPREPKPPGTMTPSRPSKCSATLSSVMSVVSIQR
jgi:hypothetical protein